MQTTNTSKTSKTNKAAALAATRAKIEAGAKPYANGQAKATRSASPDPQHKVALAHSNKVASERRKGDSTKGVQLSPKSKAPQALSAPATTTSQVVAAPAPQLSGKYAVRDWQRTKHGCGKFNVRRQFNDNLAVAAAAHCQVVAVRPHGGACDSFAFVGAPERCESAINLMAIMRWAFYEGCGEIGYKVRYAEVGVVSRSQSHDYCEAFGRGVFDKAPAFAPPPQLLADANVAGAVLSIGADRAAGFDWRNGYTDGSTCDFATWFAARHANAKVSAVLPTCLQAPIAAEVVATPAKLQTKSARTRTREQRKAA